MARRRFLLPFLALAAAALARAAPTADAPAPQPAPEASAEPGPDAPADPTSGSPPEPALDTAPEVALPPAEFEAVVRGRPRPQSPAALAPGAAVTVVDAERFAGEAKGAAELLATSPGVAVMDTGGIGRFAAVSIRGASADQVKVLLDGVPLNPSAGGGVDLSSIPPQWISRVEVVRGTEGVRHGSGSLGGVVNVVTAPPRTGSWSAAATGGSFGTWQADAQAGAGGDGWSLLGSAATSRSDGRFAYVDPLYGLVERDHNGSRLAGALLKAFVLAGAGRLDVAAQLSGGRRELPGRFTDVEDFDWQEDARGIASARFRHPGPAGVFFTTAASTRIDRMAVRLQDLGGGMVVRQRGIAGTGSLGAEWRGTYGALEAAVEGGGERLTADGMGDHSRPTYALTLAGELTGWGGRARVGPGVRLERAGAEAGVSAKLGGSVAIAGPLSVRASAGRTYRVPSFAELFLQQGVVAPNPELRPEVGIGGDAAIVVDGTYGTAALGAFSTLYRDLVVYQTVSFRRLAPANADKAVVRGVEAELATIPLRRFAGLSGRLAYTFTRSEALRGRYDILGLDLPHKPRHRLYARFGAGGAAADAHAEAQWISRQWIGFGQSGEIGDALTLGAGASARLWEAAGVRLHVEVRNLLDDRTLTDTFDNPLPGRTVLVTLRAGSNTERP